MKKVCFFGIYDRDYPRNAVLIEGLTRNGYEVVHCNVNPRIYRGLKKYWALIKEYRTIKSIHFEFVMVAFPGHTCVWLANILFPRTPIVFDVFLSLYEANVSDRKVHSARSLKALKDYFLDWHSIRLADVVTLDTGTHIRFFETKYGLRPEKSIRIFIGSVLSPVLSATSRKNMQFTVHFHGSFIPLHGVEYIIRAADILKEEKDIIFNLIGGGQELERMKQLVSSLGLKNVQLVGRLPEYSEVLERLKTADIALGVFGLSERTEWSIMNKVFEAMCFGKAIISADTPAMRELFTDGENVLFCKAGDGEDLAAKILELKRDDDLRQKIGRTSLELFKTKLLPERLVADFLVALEDKI